MHLWGKPSPSTFICSARLECWETLSLERSTVNQSLLKAALEALVEHRRVAVGMSVFVVWTPPSSLLLPRYNCTADLFLSHIVWLSAWPKWGWLTAMRWQFIMSVLWRSSLFGLFTVRIGFVIAAFHARFAFLPEAGRAMLMSRCRMRVVHGQQVSSNNTNFIYWRS